MSSSMNVADATFTKDGMVLTGLDDLTAAWGTNMANNTGYLYHRPRTLLTYTMAETKGSGEICGEGFLFLTTGTWMMYWAFENPQEHDYMPGQLRLWEPLYALGYKIIGTYDWTDTGVAEAYGSETFVVEEIQPVRWTLHSIAADTYAVVTLQGCKMNTEIL